MKRDAGITAAELASNIAIFLLSPTGRFSPVASYRSEIDALCAEIVRRTGTGAEIRLSGNSDIEGMNFVAVRDDVRIEIEGPLGQLNINVEFRDVAASITPLSWTVATPIDLLCLLARILAALDQAALAQHRPRRPCRAPCGEGVVVLHEHGGLGARTEWQAGIDALCSSIRQCVIKATVQFCPYRHGRALALDLVGPDQPITMSVSINPQGNPLDIAPDDLLEAYAYNKNRFVKLGLGFSEDLPLSSIKATVKSVARWTWSRYAGTGRCNRGVMNLDKDLPLPERQRLSATRTHELRRKATESRIRGACRALQQQGKAFTQAAIARAAGISRQTVANFKHVLDEVRKIPETVTALVKPLAKAVDVKFGGHQVTAGSNAMSPPPIFPQNDGLPVPDT